MKYNLTNTDKFLTAIEEDENFSFDTGTRGNEAFILDVENEETTSFRDLSNEVYTIWHSEELIYCSDGTTYSLQEFASDHGINLN